MQRVFNEIRYLYQFLEQEYQTPKAIALNKIDMTHLVKITIGPQVLKGPIIVMLPHKV